MEMIGIAWTQWSKPEIALAISKFTKQFLSDVGRSDIWETMSDYNQAVAESATYGATFKSRIGRTKITYINVTRSDFFDAWYEEGYEPDVIARVANRFGSKVNRWRRGRRAGKTLSLLAFQVTRRLDIQGSILIWELLTLIAYGNYKGARMRWMA